MQNLFLTNEDTFEVSLYVAVTINGGIVCDASEDAVKQLIGEDKVDIEKYTIVFKKPSYGDYYYISKGTILINALDNGVSIDPTVSRFKTMMQLLKSWDLKDKEGRIKEVNEQNIMDLNPIVATAIAVEMEEKLNKANES